MQLLTFRVVCIWAMFSTAHCFAHGYQDRSTGLMPMSNDRLKGNWVYVVELAMSAPGSQDKFKEGVKHPDQSLPCTSCSTSVMPKQECNTRLSVFGLPELSNIITRGNARREERIGELTLSSSWGRGERGPRAKYVPILRSSPHHGKPPKGTLVMTVLRWGRAYSGHTHRSRQPSGACQVGLTMI